MNYLDGVDDPYSEEDSSQASSSKRPRMVLGVFIVLMGLIGSTFAANISLNSGTRKEFGQGIFQIKACDQWVGVGMVSGASTENDKVKSMKLYGFDPRLCLGRVFNLRVYTTGNTTPLKLYVDDSATAPSGVDSATALGLVDTSTAYSSNYVGPAGTGYDAWAAAAVKIKTLQGFDIYSNSRIGIRYDKTLGTYTITFATPLALVTAVNSVTIESACYSPGNCR
jgi:hypothetical protein